MKFTCKEYYLFFLLCLLVACTNSNRDVLRTIDNLKPDRTTLKVEVLASEMDVPWDLHYGGDGYLWVTEQRGLVWRVNTSTGARKQILKISGVWRKRTTGLLGISLHPDFEKQPYVFLNYTLMRDSLIYSRLERYRFQNDSLDEPTTFLEIGGSTAHNGSRLTISPDGKIIWATGDAHGILNAQEDTCLNGKILRINLDGSIPADNPDAASYVWAKGFRNIQGLAYSDKGVLYTAEHGDAIDDEINLIKKGANYGWPNVEGFHDLEKEQIFAATNKSLEPIHAWTPVIAPSGITFYDNPSIPEWTNCLLVATLKTQSLRVLKLNDAGTSVLSEEIFFANRYGRIRDVCVGSNGALYLSTSNRDWNPGSGFPKAGDDYILKISTTNKAVHPLLTSTEALANKQLDGQQLYQQYCASCHKPDGTGVKDVFPALKGSAVVKGSTQQLIDLIVKGRNGKEGSAMPAFSFLKEDEVQTLVNYIRNSWDNNNRSASKKTNKPSR